MLPAIRTANNQTTQQQFKNLWATIFGSDSESGSPNYLQLIQVISAMQEFQTLQWILVKQALFLKEWNVHKILSSAN